MILAKEKIIRLKRTQNGRKYLPAIDISERGLICQIHKKLEKAPPRKNNKFPLQRENIKTINK